MKYIQSEVVSIQQGFLGVISIPLGIYALILYYTLTVKDGDIKGILFLLSPFLFSLSFYNMPDNSVYHSVTISFDNASSLRQAVFRCAPNL